MFWTPAASYTSRMETRWVREIILLECQSHFFVFISLSRDTESTFLLVALNSQCSLLIVYRRFSTVIKWAAIVSSVAKRLEPFKHFLLKICFTKEEKLARFSRKIVRIVNESVELKNKQIDFFCYPVNIVRTFTGLIIFTLFAIIIIFYSPKTGGGFFFLSLPRPYGQTNIIFRPLSNIIIIPRSNKFVLHSFRRTRRITSIVGGNENEKFENII